MKKQMRRIRLHRETLRQLDEPILGGVDGGGTAGTVCCTGITFPRPSVEHCGTGGAGPQEK